MDAPATIELRYSWRSRVRISVAIVITFVAGVVAATAGAPVWVRLVASLLFLSGAAVLIDAVVLTASWRMTASALKIPSVVDRRREVSGRDDLTVSLDGRLAGTVVIAGAKGARRLRANPLVSVRDLQRWFDEMAEQGATEA